MSAMDKQQVPILLKNLFRLIRATNGQPIPCLQWLDEDPEPIRDQARRAPPLNLEGVEPHQILTDIPTLRALLTAWLQLQPKSTRGYAQVTRTMSEWLVAGGQRPKMQLIGEHYQNTLGSDNSIDYLESITDFFSQVDTGLSIIELRLCEGTEWVACWDSLNAILSDARSLLPQVQLLESPRSEMLKLARELIKARDVFWIAFSTWVTSRVNSYAPFGRHGLQIVRTLLPNIQELGQATFDEITAGLRTTDYSFLLAFLPGKPLSPDSIPALKTVWHEINILLRDVAHTKEQTIDKHMRAKAILLGDIESYMCEINANHERFTGGERSTWICELTAMAKRLDIMRPDGVDFDITVKVSVFSARATLLQDKEDSDKNNRLEEQAAKTRQAQVNLTTPKTSLMKLTGYTDWIPWLHQLGEFTKDITRE